MSSVCRLPCLLTLLVGAVCAAPLLAQDPRAADPPPPRASELLGREHVEWIELRERVAGLLSQALEESPGLRDKLGDLEAALLETMVTLDPETSRRRARMAELEDAYTQAVVAEEEPDVRALVQEGVELRTALQATAAEAARQPEVARLAEMFYADLEAELARLDPEAPSLMQRVDVPGALLAEAALRPR